MKNEIENQSRRDFFIKMALAGVATAIPPLVLNSCKKEINYLGTGKVPFKVWEEMLQALKTSPDFLPQRVTDLIASKDPKAMYDFVKNEIILMPTVKDAISYYDLGNGIKWGIEGVLRCGMATPREKVELLHQMYQKAGIESKVVYERTAIKEEDVPAFFYRPFQREFKPKISKSQYKQWQKEMGGTNELDKDKKLVVDYTKEAKTLSDKIIQTLPNIDDFGSKFNFKWDNYSTPTLEFVHNERTQYAHLFDPKTPFGEKHNAENGKITKAKSIKENKEKVSLKITYRDTVDYKKDRELINGEWNAIDLIGKQIQLQFLHGLSFEEQLVTPIGNLRTFTPVLALQAIDKDLEFVQNRSFIADPITIDGKRILVSSEKSLGPNGNELLSKPHPQLQKEVQKIELNAKVSGYPIVKLSIDATDASGKIIEGLSAIDFKISDNGKPIRALLENNRPTPKILVLYDSTGSMPYKYSGEGLLNFNKNLKEKLKEKYSDVILDSRPVNYHKLYTGLLDASQTDFDLIVFIFDGGLDDTLEGKNMPIYNAGPPVLAVKAYNGYNDTSGLETYAEIAKITNGKVIDSNDQEKVIEEITSIIVEEIKIAPYVFTYASVDKTKPHVVEVMLDNQRLKAIDNYTFPAVKLEKKNGIVGLYLELKVGKNKTVKRVLAGWDPVVDYYIKPTSKEVDAVHQLLLGGVMLAIEGEGPTLSMALSDLLKSKLSNRKWGEAYLDNNMDTAVAELAKGSIHVPAILIPMLAPLQDQVTKNSLTYPTGYRMCLLKTLMPIHQEGTFTFDYLPTTKYQTIANDKKTRFVTNIKKTAQLAVREGTLFQQSTYTALQKATLIERGVASKESWLKNNIESKNRDYTYWNGKVFQGGERGYTKIFDSSANSKSFWSIGSWSGELYGIMPDGSGGGGNSTVEQLNKLQTVLKMYMAVFAKMGGVGAIGGTSLAIVAVYGKTLVQLYAIVSEAIMIMDTTGMDAKVKNALKSLAFSVYKEILFGATGGAGSIAGGLDDFISLMFNTDPFQQ